ncbi:hypothetical protein TTHERM_00334350 (macronuclear) [Tetrahymena thermophila SB210]|uniref:Uncharacterized protein n=1 Tax=Tetrahymena thermophila (strain SB210) TaxID=312017 RepID=I7MEN5_TETTS|nr:hypothetical protein TTHERM_00334350 [Tetrahymena thermophila SB210]EAR97258.2 hypothetical protein TTHERM_00334350 [Tetrahymena thermophila SB210]|eukprot:XP_001017503.2 hypothetical protein TTHERM_00334350 [Tetrahymena thermophila SB210]
MKMEEEIIDQADKKAPFIHLKKNIDWSTQNYIDDLLQQFNQIQDYSKGSNEMEINENSNKSEAKKFKTIKILDILNKGDIQN